jgi:hypothetical protein
VTESKKNTKATATIRGNPIQPLRKTLECLTAREPLRATNTSARTAGP